MNINDLKREQLVIGCFNLPLFNRLIVNNNINTIEMKLETLLDLSYEISKQYNNMDVGIYDVIEAYKYRESDLAKVLKSVLFYFDINNQYYNMCGKEIEINIIETGIELGDIYMYDNKTLGACYRLYE